MKIEINDIWNGILQTHGGDIVKNPIVVGKHNIFNHWVTWFDAKTTTVLQAIEFTDSENIKNAFDQIDLMLLVKYESTQCFLGLEYDKGFYQKTKDTIWQFRFCFDTKQ